MDKLATYGERLAWAINKRGSSAAKLQKETGIGKSSISQYINGTTGAPRNDRSAKLAKALNINQYWLDTGEGEWDANTAQFELDMILEKGTVISSNAMEGQIQIPIYGVYFCCGDGNGSCEFEEVKGVRGFPPSFFSDKNLKPENFKLVCASSDSMKPYINDKDEVGIDVSDKEVRDGEVYAILLDDDRMFKQIFREAGGTLRLRSFNSEYPDKLVTQDNHESLVIVGRQMYRAG